MIKPDDNPLDKGFYESTTSLLEAAKKIGAALKGPHGQDIEKIINQTPPNPNVRT